MKKITFLIMTVLLLFVSGTYAQKVKSEEIKIKVFFHCPNGKATIEKELVKENGVISVSADVNSQIVIIKFDKKKQNKEKLVAAIEKIGYKTEFSKADVQPSKSCNHH